MSLPNVTSPMSHLSTSPTPHAMSSDANPKAPASLWDKTKFMWIILILFLVLGIVYYTHKTRQAIQFHSAEQQVPAADRGRDWVAAVYQNIALQVPQEVYARHGSDVSIAAPR